MENLEVIWLSGIIISISLFIKYSRKKDMQISMKLLWILIIIIFNILGFAIYMILEGKGENDK